MLLISGLLSCWYMIVGADAYIRPRVVVLRAANLKSQCLPVASIPKVRTQTIPVAVPAICLRRQRSLAAADRCHSLSSLYLPRAALASLPYAAFFGYFLGGARKYRQPQAPH